LLPREEIAQAIAEHETLEVRCAFCGERYEIGDDDLRDL
jgi:redox-regulated HSP33 family molecular chaperone